MGQPIRDPEAKIEDDFIVTRTHEVPSLYHQDHPSHYSPEEDFLKDDAGGACQPDWH